MSRRICASRCSRRRLSTAAYWGDVRYAALEPVTQLWGTVVNAVRVAAQSGRATEVQKRVFEFPIVALVRFFQAARERMEVADSLHSRVQGDAGAGVPGAGRAAQRAR